MSGFDDGDEKFPTGKMGRLAETREDGKAGSGMEIKREREEIGEYCRETRDDGKAGMEMKREREEIGECSRDKGQRRGRNGDKERKGGNRRVQQREFYKVLAKQRTDLKVRREKQK